MGAGIEPILPCAPRLQRGAGDLEPVGGLTLGEPLGLQVAILLKECSASASLPSLVTIPVATWLRIHDSAHSSLLTQPWLCVNVMAKDGEGTPWLHHFMLFEVDSEAQAPAPPMPKSPQTSSAASDRKSALLPSSRQAE